MNSGNERENTVSVCIIFTSLNNFTYIRAYGYSHLLTTLHIQELITNRLEVIYDINCMYHSLNNMIKQGIHASIRAQELQGHILHGHTYVTYITPTFESDPLFQNLH